MSKPAKQIKDANVKVANPPSLTTTAIFITRDTNGLLATATEVTIEDGVITQVNPISKAPDLPATIIGVASRKLWSQYRGE